MNRAPRAEAPGRGAVLAAGIALTATVAGLGATPSSAARGKALPDWALEAAGRSAYDPAGNFAWLHQEVSVEPLPAGGVRTRRRMAGKVLSVAGLEVMASHAVAYRQGDEIRELAAWSRSPDGSVRASVRRKDEIDMAATDGISVHGDGRIRRVVAPGVMVGSFVAFESAVERRFDAGAESFLFGDLAYGVAFSRFSFQAPEGLGWDVVTHRIDGAGAIDVQRSPNGIVMTARDLRALPHEPDRPVADEILPAVWVRWFDDAGERGYRTWSDVAAWYRALADPVLEDAGEARQLGEGLAPQGTDGWLDALAGAYDFAARTVRYVSIQIGVGGYRPYSPAVVCKNRFGDCKDKTFLMRSLVGTWNVRSYPLLVRTDDLGAVDPAVPTPAQFNHCIVAVALPDGVGQTLWNTIEVAGVGRLAVLDPTARHLGPWELPTMDQGTLGLLIHEGGGEVVRLPAQPPSSATTSRRLEAALGDDGILTRGTLTESWTGNSAGSVRSFYAGRREDQQRADVAEDLRGRFPGMVVEEYRIAGLDRPGLDIVERSEVAGGRSGRRVGDLLIVEPGKLARGFGALPTGPRRWPLVSGHPREEVVEVSLAPPTGWAPEALPDAVQIRGEDVEADARWTLEDGRLVYRRSLRMLSRVIPPERFEAFREQVARVERADREGIALIPSLASTDRN